MLKAIGWFNKSDKPKNSLLIESAKRVIICKINDEREIEEIQPFIDELDELVSDKELMEFLSSLEIETCESCGKLEVESCLRSIGNEDYSITICVDCHGEQY